MSGIWVLLSQAVLYFCVMAALFRTRHGLGIGVFVCALGVMHFLETYLAAVFFIRLPFGLISPGSTVMFAGKLAMILLLYIRGDAETVRQPIYGLLIGNILMVALAAILKLYTPVSMNGYNPDLTLLNQLGALMIWGTILLFVDSLGMILLYERLGRWLERRPVLRSAAALVLVLSFDQLFFYEGLHLVAGAPPTALIGGWLAKTGAAVIYALLLVGYLRWIEPVAETGADGQRLTDLFGKLTYRYRYEELLGRTGIDALTGVSDRSRFEETVQAGLDRALPRRPVSLTMIDVDHFKAINDHHGHVTGDEVLRRVAATLRAAVRTGDHVFRYGGEEFVILCEGMAHETAIAQAERLRHAIPAALAEMIDPAPTVSIGIATAPVDGTSCDDLVRHADDNLYVAKRGGRNRVVGTPRQAAAPGRPADPMPPASRDIRGT